MASNNTSALPAFFSCPYSLDFEPQPVHTLPPRVLPIWIILIIINGLTAPFIVYINVLIISTIKKDRQLRKVNYNVLISILACADLFVGLVTQPLYITLTICLLLNVSALCPAVVGFIAGTSFYMWSLVSLTFISIERYLAIEYPFFYERHVTVRKTVTVNLVSYVTMSSTLLFSRLFTDVTYATRQLPNAVFVTACCLVNIFCVGKVNRTARRQRRMIAARQERFRKQQQQALNEAKNRLKEFKRCFTLGTILLALFIFYIPSLLIKAIGIAMETEVTPEFKYVSQFIWITCVYLQSLANPLIVSLRHSRIRQGVKRRLVCAFQ